MKLSEILSAGLIVTLLVVVGHPLWISFGWTVDLIIWIVGISMIGIAGLLAWLSRFTFLQLLFGLWGWTWFVLFFFRVFPEFAISLL